MTARANPAHRVLLTAGAEQDLLAIHDHLRHQEDAKTATHVLEQLLEIAADLAQFPQRGTFPRELIALGMREYRQILFKPWRLIYRVQDDAVIIHLIVDGRRDLRALLARRLLQA